jgi:hypothetical protein
MEGEMRRLSWSLGILAILLNYANAHPCTLLCLEQSDVLQATCYVDLQTDAEVQDWGKIYPSTPMRVGEKVDLYALNAPTSLTCPASQVSIFGGATRTVTPLRIFGTIKQGTVQAYSTPLTPGVARVLVGDFQNGVIVADPKTIKN